jgi:hypothetical protein
MQIDPRPPNTFECTDKKGVLIQKFTRLAHLDMPLLELRALLLYKRDQFGGSFNGLFGLALFKSQLSVIAAGEPFPFKNFLYGDITDLDPISLERRLMIVSLAPYSDEPSTAP